MALYKELGSRKRGRSPSVNGEDDHRTGAKQKKIRTSGRPSRVWDTLWVVHLSAKTLTEFDRRVGPNPASTLRPIITKASRLLRSDSNRLKLLAISGGLDFSLLRGVRLSCCAVHNRTLTLLQFADRPARGTMAAMGPSGSGEEGDSSTKGPSISPYDPRFQQLCIQIGMPDLWAKGRWLMSETPSPRVSRAQPSSVAPSLHVLESLLTLRLVVLGIYPAMYGFMTGNNLKTPKPHNLDSLRQALDSPHPSLVADSFTEDEFVEFAIRNQSAKKAKIVISSVYAFLLQKIGKTGTSATNRRMTNLCMIHPEFTMPQPDIFDGADQRAINPRVLDDLHDIIVPTNLTGESAAPNHFMEFHAHDGSLPVLQRQVSKCNYP